MAEPTLADIIAETSGLASRLRAEAGQMRAETRRQGQTLLLWGALIVIGISVPFLRIARYLDYEQLVSVTGDTAVRQGRSIVQEASTEARNSAPEVVRGTESAVVATVPGIGRELEGALHGVEDGIASAVEPWDIAFIEEAKRMPDGRKRLAAAAREPANAARLLAPILDKVKARADVQQASRTTAPAVLALRDHLRLLRAGEKLTLPQQIERGVVRATAFLHER
jgi:hypothetical protein